MAAARAQLGGSDGDEQLAQGPHLLQPCDVLHRLLPLLLPAASGQQREYVAAMLQPFASAHNGSSTECASPAIPLEQLAVAAAECAAVERRLAQQPAAEALQGLRQAAAALGSRSLDLAAAFAAAEGQQLAPVLLVSRRGCGLAEHALRLVLCSAADAMAACCCPACAGCAAAAPLSSRH